MRLGSGWNHNHQRPNALRLSPTTMHNCACSLDPAGSSALPEPSQRRIDWVGWKTSDTRERRSRTRKSVRRNIGHISRPERVALRETKIKLRRKGGVTCGQDQAEQQNGKSISRGRDLVGVNVGMVGIGDSGQSMIASLFVCRSRHHSDFRPTIATLSGFELDHLWTRVPRSTGSLEFITSPLNDLGRRGETFYAGTTNEGHLGVGEVSLLGKRRRHRCRITSSSVPDRPDNQLCVPCYGCDWRLRSW